MKKHLIFLLALAFSLSAAAQDDTDFRLAKPDITLELETSANALFTEGEFDEMVFKMNRLRMGVAGGLGSGLSYHFRMAFHKSFDKFSLDNISKSVELAKVTWTPNERWDFSAGKMFVVHGGYENYVNVLLVREFTDFNSCIEVYQTGVQASYHTSNDQSFTLQVVNNRAESHQELFQYGLPDGIEASRLPLMGTFNWDGFFADRSIRLMYAATASQIAKGKYLYYLTAGNIYEKGPVLAYLDIMYARADVDKHQRITSLGGGLLPTAQNVEYLTLIADFEYQFTPKWNAYVKGAYETANVFKENGPYRKGRYLTTWNAQACVEWFPFTKEKGLKVYLHYVYKANELQDDFTIMGAGLPDTQRISLGLTYSIPVL